MLFYLICVAILSIQRAVINAEADKQSLINGRATQENLPSKLIENVSKMITELSFLWTHGYEGLTRYAKENDDEENEDDVDENETKDNYGESRGKKKKKRKAIIKLLIVGAVAAVKLALLLKLLALKIQLKFLLIAVLSLLINGARFFYDLKKGHQPQKVVYYEHAQHQHHYDHEEDWGGGGGHWDRSLLHKDDQRTAQDLAYSRQRPYNPSYSLVNNKPNYSFDDK